MNGKILLSVDFDFFVRELPEWDWGHNESAIFYETVWPIRYSSFKDLVAETSPVEYADFLPEKLIDELTKLDIRLSPKFQLGVGDSHSFAENFLKKKEATTVVNLDAHHDIYSRLMPITCGNWAYFLMERWHKEIVWIRPKWLKEGTLSEPVCEKSFWEGTWADMEKFRGCEIEAVFLARSGAWVPPHLDPAFVVMVKTFTAKPHGRVVDYGLVVRTIPKPEDIDRLRNQWAEQKLKCNQLIMDKESQ